MSKHPRILHLIDDATAGGVLRVIDHIVTSPDLAREGHHRVQYVTRGKISAKAYDADIIVSHLSISWRSLPMLMIARASNASTPFVHVEHSYTEAFSAQNVRNQARFATLLRIAFSLFDRIVAVSRAQADWIERRDFCRADKIVEIQSCVDLSIFRAMAPPKGPVRVFSAIGRLETQKGFDTLIKAFRKRSSRNVELHIFGEGHDEIPLRNLAAGDDAIVFKGFARTPKEAFENADVVLMPSRWEAYGLVAVEALSAGRQLFCNNLDGLRDHTAGGAHLVSGRTISEWTDAIDVALTEPNANCENGLYRISDILERNFSQSWTDLIAQVLPVKTQSIEGGG